MVGDLINLDFPPQSIVSGTYSVDRSQLARKLTAQDKTDMLVRKKQFAQWLEAKILKGDDHDSIGNIMIWPFSPQEPQYRDAYPR